MRKKFPLTYKQTMIGGMVFWGLVFILCVISVLRIL